MDSLVEIKMPEGQQEGTQSFVAKWLKHPGESVAINEPILEISTDKVTVEVSSPASGVLKEIVKNENDEVTPGTVLGTIEMGGEAGKPAARAERISSQRTEAAAAVCAGEAELSPAVRKLLKEHNLDASAIKGSGRGGRITHQDVLDHVERAAKSGGAAGAGGRIVPHSPMRRTIASHMVQSLLHTAPHVTTVFEADLSKVMEHREKHRKEIERMMGARLTLTAYFVQAAVKALQAVPEVNARWRDEGLEIFDDCNIGIATALGNAGLVVPVLQQAQTLDLGATAKKLEFLIDRARKGTLSSDEVQGGTFTITNHGVSGSLIATPIINQPQSAILGIGKVERRVKVCEDSNGEEVWVAKPMVYVTLTIDHRALDGFTANSFLGVLVNVLENWE